MGTFKSRNPNFYAEIKERLKGQKFMHLMGFDLTEIEEGRIVGEMDLQDIHLQQFGYTHGGVTATISDICMGFAAYSLVPVGFGTVTANISIDYLKPGKGDKIIAIGQVEKAGKSMMFCTGKVFTEKSGVRILIATSRSVMAVVEASNH